jgi:pyruvate dehydrogenase E1 component alpha subunit
MREDDYMFVTYRGHNHVLARGTPMTAVMAELLGRENGLMRGKGGSMHLLDVSKGVLGSYAIIGAQLVIANGTRGPRSTGAPARSPSASSATARPTSAPSTRRSTWPPCGRCRSSSSARTTGTWSTRRSRRSRRSSSPAPTARRLRARLPDRRRQRRRGGLRDGLDAIEKARQGGGPSLIEALTYRHGGTRGPTRASTGPAEEVAEWLARDPIPAYRQILISRGVGEAVLDKIDAEAKAAVDLATEEAKAGAEPRPELAFTDVWSDGGWEWRN